LKVNIISITERATGVSNPAEHFTTILGRPTKSTHSNFSSAISVPLLLFF
jgi:hypothetical protein